MKQYLLYTALAIIIAYLLFRLHADNSTKSNQIDSLTWIAEHHKQAADRHKQAANKWFDEAMTAKARRDTIYGERVRVVTQWRERAPQSDSKRLDSCIEVGAIVLRELEACDSAYSLLINSHSHQDSAIVRLDSVVIIQEVIIGDVRQLTKQRDRARWWAVAGWAVAVGRWL